MNHKIAKEVSFKVVYNGIELISIALSYMPIARNNVEQKEAYLNIVSRL